MKRFLSIVICLFLVFSASQYAAALPFNDISTNEFNSDSKELAFNEGNVYGTSNPEIKNVSITVDEIVSGVSTPMTLKISVDDGIGGLKTEEATVKWFMKNAAGTWDRMNDTDVFQTGESYSIDYFVFTRSGYTISQAVTGTCNGSPSITEYGPVRNSDNCIYISGAFGPLEGEVTEKTMIEKVFFTIDEPEAGKTAKDMTWSVTTVPEGALDMSRSTVIWYKCGSKNRNSNKWTEVKEGEAFAVGTFYSPDVFLYPANGYGFSPLTEGYINGMEPETYFGKFFRSDKEVYLAHMFDAVGGIPFTDVTGTDYFRSAVYWAYNSCPQITDGTSKTTFSPMRTCTRGQVVTFLWRSMGEPEPMTTTNPFTDVKTTDYYYKPVLWAVENGITDGTSSNTFSPSDTCKNSHILAFIYRAMGEPNKTGQGTWYSDAYNWAYTNGLLDGSYTGTYDINGYCSRGNVVQYLYKYNTINKTNISEQITEQEPVNAQPDNSKKEESHVDQTYIPRDAVLDPFHAVPPNNESHWDRSHLTEGQQGITYILNTKTKKFHYSDCSSVHKMSENNKQEYTGSREEIINAGYVPCKICEP